MRANSEGCKRPSRDMRALSEGGDRQAGATGRDHSHLTTQLDSAKLAAELAKLPGARGEESRQQAGPRSFTLRREGRRSREPGSLVGRSVESGIIERQTASGAEQLLLPGRLAALTPFGAVEAATDGGMDLAEGSMSFRRGRAGGDLTSTESGNILLRRLTEQQEAQTKLLHELTESAKRVEAKEEALDEWKEMTTQTLASLVMQVNDLAHAVSSAAKSQHRWL